MSHTNNKEVERIEEIVVNAQCDAGDVVTGWVIQSDEARRILHQELQKAQQDWLRGEIVKLDGMKGGIDDIDIPPLYKTLAEKVTFKNGHNQALQTIIDRYKDELDQDVSK